MSPRQPTHKYFLQVLALLALVLTMGVSSAASTGTGLKVSGTPDDALLKELSSMPADRIELLANAAASCGNWVDDISHFNCVRALRMARIKNAAYKLAYERSHQLEISLGLIDVYRGLDKKTILKGVKSRGDVTIEFMNGISDLVATLETYYARPQRQSQ